MASGTVKGSEFVLLTSSDVSVAVNANGRVTTPLSNFVTIPNGYEIASITPIIAGSGTGYCDVHLNGTNGDNSVVGVVVHNGSSSAVTALTRVHVLCHKT